MAHPDITEQLSSLASRYQYHKPPAFILALQETARKVLQWCAEWLDSLNFRMPGAADSRPLSTTLTLLLYAAGLLAAIALIWVLVKQARKTRTAVKPTKKGAEAIERILDSAALRNEAEQYANAGDFRAACRSIYLSFLQALHEKEIAIFAPTKTNYEYSYLLKSHDNLHCGFKELADCIELVWFGNKTADRLDFENCRTILKKMEPEILDIYTRKKAAKEASKGYDAES